MTGRPRRPGGGPSPHPPGAGRTGGGPADRTPTVRLPGGGGHPARRGTGIVGRSVLVTCAVALISVLVTAAVAVPLARAAAMRQARQNLAEQSDLVSSLVVARDARPVLTRRLLKQLRDHGVELSLVRDGKADRGWVPPKVVRAVAAGRSVDASSSRGGRRVLVAGRPSSPGEATGSGVVLAQPVARLPVRSLLSLVLALAAGLAAGIVAGALLARRLSRPIRRAAQAARRIGAGDRSVRLPVEPPHEVAELSAAMNGLAGALTDSEGRQRDFLLSVSHELRTPLTAIRGYSEALADGVLPGSEAPRVRETGLTVLAEAERLDRLVTDLLALARLSARDFPIEVVDVDLVELARTAGTAWRHRCAEAGVDLRTELPSVPVPVRTDPGRIRQVLDGLLENAFRVVPAGAPLVVAVATGAGPGGPVAVLDVRDGGPGLSDEDLATAFERGRLYQKYRGVRPVGTGLGLALAARLVARLGGNIEAGHAPEGGARFTVTLPAQPSAHPYQVRTLR